MYLRSLFLLALSAFAEGQQQRYSGTRYLWYNTSGFDFNSALAVGNGRLGAMVHGSPIEKLILNENSVWSDKFIDRVNPGSLSAFPEVRKMLTEGQLTEAGQLVLRNMSAIPNTSRMYSVTNNLLLDFGHNQTDITDYERWLDTYQGNSGVRYQYEGVEYTREVVANYPVGVIAIRLTASKKGELNVNVSLARERGIVEHTASTETNTITLNVGGSNAGSIAFSSGVRVVADEGKTSSSDGKSLFVSGATTVDLFFDAESEFQWDSEAKYKAEVTRKLDQAASVGFDSLKDQAIKDHSSLIGRVELNLGSSGDVGSLPTNVRIAKFKTDSDADNEFVTLMFNFGRHLLVSASRDTGGPGLGVPANLQGLWNDKYSPPWGGKFTVNINTEMNYWLAETTNLADTLRPLWDLMARGQQRGQDVAQRMYGCPGYVQHHNLDLWGDAAPHDNGTKWTMWPMSNLWLASHMMEHYRFTGDEDFLRQKAWPIFKDAATFHYCYLFMFEGYWSSGPSISPENDFVVPAGMSTPGAYESIDISPTLDNSLLYDLFTNIIGTASVLGISDDEIVTKAASYRSLLRPTQIGSLGQIQEWRNDYVEGEPAHRHISHLWDLFPGSRMSPLLNASLATAARVTLNRRLQSGGASTGWSRAWTTLCFARLLDGDAAWEHAQILLQRHPLTNGFHGIEDPTFQIDSNFGLVAAVAEMLVQSHAGVVHLLPALGSKVATGSVKGLVARGGFEVALEWSENTLTQAKIFSRRGGKLAVRVADGVAFKIDGQAVDSVTTAAGRTYTVTL